MNGLKSLLLELRHSRGRSSQLPGQLRVNETAEQLARLYTDIGRPPQPRDLGVLHRRLSLAADTADFSTISTRDWREAVWCLWRQDRVETQPLINKPSFWDAYVQWIERRERHSDYRNLVLSWLHGFNYQRRAPQAASAIQKACGNWPNWPWAKRHQSWQTFDIDAGPTRLASLVMAAKVPVTDTLKSEGFGEWLQTCGYVEAAYVEMLRQLPKPLTTASIDRALEWSAADDKRLRYPLHKGELAERLLLPWHPRESAPPPGAQKAIQSFLLQHLNDPRLKPGEWFGVEDTAIHVFKRWLIGASLDHFIRIIEQVAESGHWRYRKAFWMSYFRRDYITDAWIVMGRNARRLASKIDDLQGNYGMLEGAGVLPNHSVLLMRIGDLVIADWSHNGTCRIWHRENEKVPTFYQPQYIGSRLRTGADTEIPHYGSQYGNWQGKVVSAIRDKTRILVPQTEFMP